MKAEEKKQEAAGQRTPPQCRGHCEPYANDAEGRWLRRVLRRCSRRRAERWRDVNDQSFSRKHHQSSHSGKDAVPKYGSTREVKGFSCERQRDREAERPPSFFQKRPPETISSSGSHKDDRGSSACSTFSSSQCTHEGFHRGRYALWFFPKLGRRPGPDWYLHGEEAVFKKS